MMSVLRAVWRRPAGRTGLVLVLVLLGFSLLGAWLIPWEPNRVAVLQRFQAPSWQHALGTDHLGRDLAARMAYGGRIALLVAACTIGAALLAGVPLGLLAAYAPAGAGRALAGGFDLLSAFPTAVFALAVVALLGPGLWKVVLIVAVSLAPHYGRVARAQALALRSQPFLEAARALGAGAPRVALRHMLPNMLGPLLVLASMDVPGVIAIEAGLSFLGVGVPPPQASWGTLLNDGYANLTRTAWPLLCAAAVLALATLGFTLLGEALRDAVDPRLRARA